MKQPNEGARVRVTTKNGVEYDGTVLPGDGLVLKLRDGYNVGIAQRNIEAVETLEETEKEGGGRSEPVEKDASLPNVVILHTGGTIASKVDYETGATTNLVEPEELLAQYPELQDVAHVEAEFIANMSSDDMRFAHYNLLIDAVKRTAQKGVAGIIVTHGTDTLHYTSAALHYALRGIDVPVVLVGSQRSSDRGSSDAATNLLGATRFITEAGYPGVYVAMHDSLDDTSTGVLRGINCRKMHTSRRDAFQSINAPQVARVSADGVEVLAEPPVTDAEFSPTKYDGDVRVGMCYVHPNFSPEELACYEGFDGLVLLGTGLGHAPINTYDDHTLVHKDVKDALSSLVEEMPVVMTSQCVSGRVNMQVYSAGRRHLELGVLGHDLALTPETAYAKLAWLLSQGKDAEKEFSADYGDAIERTEEQSYERS